MGGLEGKFSNVFLSRRAEKDLDHLRRVDPANFERVWEDPKRYALGRLPQSPKALKGFHPPLWQFDSGDFCIFHTWEGPILWVRGVLRKSDQSKRIRGLR